MNQIFFLLLSIHIFHSYLYIGVVDRIEGSQVVILFEDARKEIILEKNEQLNEDKWFLFYWREKEPFILKALTEIESERKLKSKQLLEKLRKQNSSSLSID